MLKLKKRNDGSITIEACLALTMFIFLILTIYSFFIIFEAEGRIADCLIRSGQSLSLDVYASEKLTTDWKTASSVSDLFTHIALQATEENEMFVSTSKWYKAGDSIGGVDAATNTQMNEEIKERFIAYLVGGTSDTAETEANDLLTKLRVENGLDGLDFTGSYVDTNGDLYIVVKYKLNYIFDFPKFGLEPLEMEQKSVTRLWQ